MARDLVGDVQTQALAHPASLHHETLPFLTCDQDCQGLYVHPSDLEARLLGVTSGGVPRNDDVVDSWLWRVGQVSEGLAQAGVLGLLLAQEFAQAGVDDLGLGEVGVQAGALLLQAPDGHPLLGNRRARQQVERPPPISSCEGPLDA